MLRSRQSLANPWPSCADRSWPQSSQTLPGAPPVDATPKMVHIERSPRHVVHATCEPAQSTGTLMVPRFPFTVASQVCCPSTNLSARRVVPTPSRFRRSSLSPMPNRATYTHRSRRPGASSDAILSPPEPMPSPIERDAEPARARRPLEIADTKVGSIVYLGRSASNQVRDKFVGCHRERGAHVEILAIDGPEDTDIPARSNGNVRHETGPAAGLLHDGRQISVG